MKNFFDHFIDFFSGGFFNYLGAFVRLPFSKMKFAELLEDNQSNNMGMLVTALLMLLVFAYIKFSIN